MTKILLIEDNASEARIVNELLEDAGIKHQVEERQTLSEAIGFLEKNQVDLVLSDLSLPDSAGVETFLKLSAKFPNLPIIILSNLGDIDIATKLIEIGAEDYIFKSDINKTSLANAIRNAIARSPSPRISLNESLVEQHIKNYEYDSISFDNNSLKDLEPEIFKEFTNYYKLAFPLNSSAGQDDIEKDVNSIFRPHIDAILMLRISPNDVLDMHKRIISDMGFVDVNNPEFRKTSSMTYFQVIKFLYNCYSESLV